MLLKNSLLLLLYTLLKLFEVLIDVDFGLKIVYNRD